ncbi:MAG: YajQ family cyclic di-GMP-binding protein [Candidatus Eisenbacteria bacterium]|nr:YajQ family cyclic di-GMP-binding protein [Candidatus Eisenbacteria bacterium]
MAKSQSFDVTTGVDFNEVNNAVQQALKEIGQRYDFKGADVTLDLKEEENMLVLQAPDDYKLRAAWDILHAKLIRRGQPAKNFETGEPKPASHGSLRQEITIQNGLSSDLAREVVKFLKDAKMKKVQAAIQGDTVRISGPSRDDLQEAIALLKTNDFGVELKFENFRSQ